MRQILLIEDDQLILEMYQEKFRKEGFYISSAINGKEGLAFALQNHPELILLDIAMPIMDGLSVIKELRKDTWGKDVPVILLTNLNPDRKILDAIVKNYPAYCLMKADVTPEDVVKKVTELLAEKQEK